VTETAAVDEILMKVAEAGDEGLIARRRAEQNGSRATFSARSELSVDPSDYEALHTLVDHGLAEVTTATTYTYDGAQTVERFELTLLGFWRADQLRTRKAVLT
jgi:hypothetical protein